MMYVYGKLPNHEKRILFIFSLKMFSRLQPDDLLDFLPCWKFLCSNVLRTTTPYREKKGCESIHLYKCEKKKYRINVRARKLTNESFIQILIFSYLI